MRSVLAGVAMVGVMVLFVAWKCGAFDGQPERHQTTTEPPSAVATESASDSTCSLVADRFIQRAWHCGLNMSDITADKLCAGDNRQATSSMRYLAHIETCNEFQTRMFPR